MKKNILTSIFNTCTLIHTYIHTYIHIYIHTLLNNKKISIFDSDLIGVDYIDSGPTFSVFNLLGESI